MRVKTWRTIAKYEKMSCRSTFECILQTLTCGTTKSATECTLESLAQVKLGRPRVSIPRAPLETKPDLDIIRVDESLDEKAHHDERQDHDDALERNCRP